MGRKKTYKSIDEALEAKKQQNKIRYQNKKEEIKKKLKENDSNKKSLDYYHKNKEEIRKKKLLYYKKNKNKYSEYGKNYRLKNKEEINKRKNLYQSNKLKNNNLFKLRCNISSLIRFSFKGNGYCKKSKTADILGCSFEEFKQHLESRFELWMTWDNHGNPKDGIYELNKTWDLDHIIPISTAISEEDVIRLNHHTNFQPLCSYTNRFIKINKI